MSYHNDRRVRAGRRKAYSPIKGIDNGRMKMVVHFAGDDEENVHELPIKFDVCHTCDGRGTHVNPSVDCDGLTAADFDEDLDFAEYYIDGVYDVECYECDGKRVVPVVERERADPTILARLDEYYKEMSRYDAEVESERRYFDRGL